MTAVLLVSVGSLIEYSKNSDKSILMICIFEGFTKIIMGLYILKVLKVTDGETNTTKHGQRIENTLEQDFLQNIKTISHAFNNVIKFILIIYVTKWVDRKNYIIWIGFFYAVIGASFIMKDIIKKILEEKYEEDIYLGTVAIVTGIIM